MPSVREWFEEIEDGLKYRQVHGREDSWAGLESAFYEADTNRTKGPNLILSQGDAMMSSVAVPYPRINVIAERPEYLENAKVEIGRASCRERV